MILKAVIFDLDGTLLDTIEDIATCVNAGLDKMGDPKRTKAEVKSMVGDGVEMLCRRALTRLTKDRLAAMLEFTMAYYKEHLNIATRPFPGVEAALHELKSLNLALSVLSNKPHELTVKQVIETFGDDQFDKIIGLRDGFPPKPDPSGALEIAEAMKVAPSECLYIGDSEVDVLTGKGAGMKVVAVTWGFRSVNTLVDNGASILVDSPEEIVAMAKSFQH